MVRAFLQEIPVPTAGLALGVIALGKLLASWATWAEMICLGVAIVLIALVSAKALFCTKHLREDLAQPVQAAVFGTFFMTYMQLSTYLVAVSLNAARLLWISAVLGHFVLMIWFSAKHFRDFDLKNVFATWFVCYVGIIVGSVTSPSLQLVVLGQGLFWFGFVAYAALLIVVTLRYVKHEVPAGAAPTFCIYAAPMSLSLAGYLAVYEVPNMAFVIILEVLAQGLFILVLTKVATFIRKGFFPSFAAMTFPFVITATALAGSVVALRSEGLFLPVAFDVLIGLEIAFATIMTAFVFGHYMCFFARKFQAIASDYRCAEERVAQ